MTGHTVNDLSPSEDNGNTLDGMIIGTWINEVHPVLPWVKFQFAAVEEDRFLEDIGVAIPADSSLDCRDLAIDSLQYGDGDPICRGNHLLGGFMLPAAILTMIVASKLGITLGKTETPNAWMLDVDMNFLILGITSLCAGHSVRDVGGF